jgi:murein DD-endopeptidase MepM/ murein hydrolase activator NlpD
MKNLIINKITAVFLTLIMVFGLIPSMGFAQSNPASSLNEVKGFNMAVFDSHFSRADREINPERWLAEARIGVTQAVYAWELIAFGMYENPFLFEEAKARLEDWSGKELETRFSQWLNKRFFGEAIGKAVSEFNSMLGETQKKYTWHLDEEGNVVFDERTGDPLVIRPGEEGREFSEDRIVWRREADELIGKNSGFFDTVMINMYPELLAYIPMELRETMSAAIKEAGAAASANLKREFENIAAREQRIFTSRRTRDILSLRKKSDEEAARVFTEQLIAQTEQACAIGIENLNAKIEQAYAGADNLALIGEEWLQLYKEQFDRGLKAWEEAEERFFIRRIEWEQDSVRLFSEGEDAWLAAFEKINEEYQKWELKAKELFDAGEQLFKNISEDLENSIAAAKDEFEINKNMRVGTGTEKVKALIDMYITGASAAITAKENLQYWLEDYFGEENVPEGNMAEIIESIEDINIQKYYSLYKSYMGIATEARGKIIADYAEILGTGALKDIFSPDASTEDFYLDEYQLALVRAKTLVLYWERKTSIAQAVLSYSKKTDAERMTEAESIKAWEKAKADYNNSLALYEEELNELNNIGMELQSKKTVLDGLAAIMSEEEKELNRLSQEHSMLVAAGYASIGDVAGSDFNIKYKFLVNEYKNFMKTGNDALYKDILEYGRNWSIAQQKEEAENILASLVKEINSAAESSEEPESPVLIKTRLAIIDLFADGIAYGVAVGIDYQLRSINSAYSGADWYSKAKGIDLSKEEKTALYGEKLEERLFEDYNNSHLTLLKKRLNYELNILKNILDIDPTAANYENTLADAMSELKINIFRPEDITFLYNVLSDLKKRIDTNKGFFTEDNEENMFIEYYIMEDSFCVNTEKELIDFYNDYNYCSNLLDVYLKYAVFSSFGQKENRQDFFRNINAFLSVYGLNIEGKIFPDAQSIYNAILKKGGDLEKKSILFFEELKNYFSVSPKWLENEFYPWRNAVLEYITANIPSLEEETNNEKHWRQFLKEEFIKNADTALLEASTREEGVIEDARFAAEYYTNRINDAINLFSQTDFSVPTKTAQTLYNYYSYIFSDMENRFYSLNYYYNDISRLGRSLEISKLSKEEVKTQSDSVYSNLIVQEGKFNKSRDNYFEEAGNFFITGGLYDEQYKAVKKAYEDTESKRFEYEKEDAIRRWASTAYLGTDTDNYEECKNKLEKAQTALDVLLELKEKQTYNNPEYNALYSEYEQSFTRKIKALDAFETVFSTLAQETKNNEYYFKNYRENLFNLGALSSANTDKISVDIIMNWPHKEIITVKDGKLAFYRDLSLTNETNSTTDILDNIKSPSWKTADSPNAAELADFINSKTIPDGGRHEISLFEEALKGLSQRMAEYLEDPYELMKWCYAREYIISSLINENSNLNYLSVYLSGLGKIEKGKSLGGELYRPGLINRNYALYTHTQFIETENENVFQGKNYYLSFSETEKADLEFYVILTLTGGGNDYISGFKEIIDVNTYQKAFDLVNGYYKYAARQKVIGFLYEEMKEINKHTSGRIETVLNESKDTVNNFISGVYNDLFSIQNYGDLYLASCNKINILNGEKNPGQNILWSDIRNALTATNKFKSEDIRIIRASWDKMQSESFSPFMNLYDALSGLVIWTKGEEERIKNDLEKVWLADTQKQQENERKYLSAMEAFISGTGSINTLKDAAEKAYGENSVLQINHLNNKHAVLINDFSMYLTMENNHNSEFASLGNDIQLLTNKILENRYKAELEAREIEWEQMRADILVKANEWQNTVSLVMGNGRTEWDAGIQKMLESKRQWYTNFQNEIRRVENEWEQAYLAGLEDKETWLEQAASAFNQASADSFPRLVGMEGERLSRFMDAREPFGIRDALPEAHAIMTNLLQSSGIVNMTSAFGSINNISDTAAFKVRNGLGGVSSWDAAIVKTAAKDIARTTNAEIADAEAKKLAHTAKKTVSEMISGIYSNVKDANRNFRESMDNQFIMEGLWRRNGTNYEKDIVKGSTLFQPVISQRQTVEGYIDYIIEPVSLNTNMDESFLVDLNSIAIRALIDSAYEEVKTISEKIFVNVKDNTPDAKGRERPPGEFGVHIGFRPDVKETPGNTRESFFYDEGEGQLGRLMSDFIYWKIIDSRGSAELSLAPWDKRMWNDENSSFSAPTLRTVGQIAATVAVTIASGGAGIIGGAFTLGNIATTALVSSASNILFGTLDAAYGYKSFGEAAFDVGKSLLVNSASSAISGVFGSYGNLTSNAVKTASGTAGIIITETAMTGLQSITSSMAANALNSFTYKDGHIGWSNEMFSSGMKDVFSNALVSMAGTFTTQSLTAINSGFDLGKLIGFSKENVIDIKKFNGLVGSLAGQGVNYAMGGDFTLNLLNLSLLTKNDQYNTGLLELHLGRNGTTMNLGTGGANISLDNLASAFKGLKVWDVNSMINRFIKKEDDFDSAIALRTQYGFGDATQKNQLWDILNGEAIINTNAEGKFGAESVMNENGKKVINLAGYKSGMSVEDQLLVGVLLGHEAYRDGIVTDDNYLETRTAVFAHTEMAIRMIQGGYLSLFNNDNLRNDIVAYNIGGDFFNNYIDKNYDSSGDFWKLMRDGTLVNDNSGWLVDETGKQLYNADGKPIGAGGMETGLLNILFGGTSGVTNENYTDEQVKFAQQLMSNAGMKYTASDKNDIRTYSWKGNETGQSLDMQAIMKIAGSTVAAPVFARYYEDTAIAFTANILGKKVNNTNEHTLIGDAFSRFSVNFLPEVFGFYLSMRNFFDASANMKVTGKHGATDPKFQYKNYENEAHFGTDFANGKKGDSIYLGISGKVVFTDKEEEPGKGNGNWMVVEHGYKFDGSFIGTGIFGEYMHMEKQPEFKTGSYLESNQIIGTVGNTGHSSGAHLHYSIYTLRQDTFSVASLNMILNNKTTNTVTSKNAAYYQGTYGKYASKKVTYDIENFLNGLKK